MNSLNIGQNQNFIIKSIRDEFLVDVLHGLQKEQKEIPCKYFYDEQGSILFDKICNLDEYYPTRTELSIMKLHIDEITQYIGDEAILIELGSGSSLKTRVLLDNLQNSCGYIPIDISQDHLLNTSEGLKKNYPQLPIFPVHTDYTKEITIPDGIDRKGKRVVYFPGSTIGNFHPDEAIRFLSSLHKILDPDDALIIGVDLKKDPSILHRAYNDFQGLTAAFNLNLLKHANRELGTNFRTDLFSHYAFYNPTLGRVEMHLISHEDQDIRIADTTIRIADGESIHTENSYKYSPGEFSRLAKKAGFIVDRVWTDNKEYFSVQILKPIFTKTTFE